MSPVVGDVEGLSVVTSGVGSSVTVAVGDVVGKAVAVPVGGFVGDVVGVVTQL